MDLEAIKRELLDWLAVMKLPAGTDAASWEDLIREYPPETEGGRESGLRIRLALRLSTRDNRYLISIFQDLAAECEEVYIISTHKDWKTDELAMQRLVDEAYHGRSDDALKAKHTLWVQTFRPEELSDALNACAVAIISNELTGGPEPAASVESVPRFRPTRPQFPDPVDDPGSNPIA